MKQIAWIILGWLALVSYSATADEVQDKALISAAQKGNVEEVKRQLKAGAKVDAIDLNKDNYDGLQAIHYAAWSGNIQEVKILLGAGAKVDAINYHGIQPLHYAAISGSVDLVKALLIAGAQINAVDEYGEAAIHIAAEQNKLEIVKFLIASGANIRIADMNGMLPLQRATLAGHTEIANILRETTASPKNTASVQPQKSLSALSPSKTGRNMIAPGIELPRKVADYYVQTKGNWKNGNPYDGGISVSKISPNIYKIDFSFQQPIDYPESGQIIITLTQCLADHIAEITQSKGWDVGDEKDMIDRNFGKPFSNLSYLILTGAKDGESRERATGRKTMSWTYGDILDNKDLRYRNGYPSVIGDCKKLLKPEFSTYFAPNNFILVKGKKLPTRLWALANQEQMGVSNEWDLLKNGTLKYESKNSRLLKIEIGFDDSVNNMYMLPMSLLAGCIGSYMAPQKDYEAFAIGWPKKSQTESSGIDSSSKMVFYTIGLNSGDDIGALSGQINIEWMASKGKIDIANQKIVSKNMADTCSKMVKSDYIDTTKAQQ